MAKGKYVKRRDHGGKATARMVLILAVLLLFMGSMLVFKACQRPDVPGEESNASTEKKPGFWNPFKDPHETTEPSTEPTTVPTEPFVSATASVGVTGDILVHGPLIEAAKQNDGTYDFNNIYTYIQDYYNDVDFMIANLEVTLGGEAAGEYRGYPTFNCPDSMIDALKNAGVDMMLTANNHTYDTGHNGFVRTQEVLDKKGMPHLGTRLSEDTDSYIVQDINGIKVGLVCYTYESGRTEDGRKALNGIPVTAADTNLVSTFSYDNLTGFYNEVEQTLAAMEEDGADFSMVFMHWGEEYQLSPNSRQTGIAQSLCELGVDIIVGGHPHVIQPFSTLTSTTGHQTYCIYSVGNAVSNQRRETLETSPNQEHTEDGMIFSVEFEKWSDGRVNISDINILPTWVERQTKNSKRVYTIVPLDLEVDWNTYDIASHDKLYPSYDQTMALVGAGLNDAKAAFGKEPVPLYSQDPPAETTAPAA